MNYSDRVTLTATCEGHCQETDALVFRADIDITYRVEPGYPQTHDEPGQPDVCEFLWAHIHTPCGLVQADPMLQAWAEGWLEENEDHALDVWRGVVAGARDEARELAA